MRRMLQRCVPPLHSFNNIIIILLACAAPVFTQSRDASYPTAVVRSEIEGRISPRDIGDARLTRHFYTFTGLEGDLVITVESTDLNGDIDLFTADSLRPLTKITLYAGATATRATKSVYLRQQEPLVLRVEGRTASESDAVYRIRFEGAFSPASGQLAQAQEPVTPTLTESASRDRNVTRVNSVGARIEEPATETETAAQEAQPEATPTPERDTAASSGTTRRGTTAQRRNRPARQPTRTNTRRTNPSGANQTAATPERDDARTAPPSSETSAAESPATGEATSNTPARTRAARNRPTRRGRRNEPPAEQAAASVPSDASSGASVPATPAASPRLIIVTRDGETLSRDMSTVRRVTIENNQIVVVGRDGKVTRQPMANVVRMAIEP